ncbi:DUF2398 family protein [Kitasatospora sp. NPDC094015]|uniref:DUF2398 family protein n=1 Tax=Kitasatospora sp. NPDC094015 TaxID=3155205 RepID=UPI0033229B44
MEQHEYATGAGEVPGRTGIGRAGGAGQLTAQPSADLYPAAQELAARLAQAPPQAAHDLFTAAFGLYGARHFGAALEPADPAPADTSWWHGPSAHRSAALRTRPLRYRRGRGDAAGAPAPAPVPVPGPAEPPGGAGRHRKPERPRGAAEPASAVERRTAARLLLAHPLVTDSGPHAAGFPLVRRHADWLAERFERVLGYRLSVAERHARLQKAPLPGRTLPGFAPASYACLVLALGALADGRAPDLDHPQALAVLRGWQVVGRDADGGPVVDRELAAALAPAAPLPAAGPELTVRRLLVETPVVLLDELSPAERDWLLPRRGAEAALLADFLGLRTEVRAEGVALLDPADELTDLALPGTGTLAQAALLLVQRLVEELRPLPGEAAPPAVLIPDALIDGALGDVTDDHGLRAGWSPEYLADRPAFRRDVLDLLAGMRLIAPAGRAWLLRAPAARYAPAAEPEPVPGSGRHSRPHGDLDDGPDGEG